MTTENPFPKAVLIPSANRESLPQCLLGIAAQQKVKPDFVIVRLETGLNLDSFYLAQAADVLAINGIRLEIILRPSSGIRAARQDLLDYARIRGFRVVWWLDDDTFPHPFCFSNMLWAFRELKETSPSFVQGAKPDVNNRRGYGDFDLRVHHEVRYAGGRPNAYPLYNFYYEPSFMWQPVQCKALDMGNVMFDLSTLSAESFMKHDESGVNAGGEDTEFALQLDYNKKSGVFQPNALAFHLEKPLVRFDEEKARVSRLLALCSENGYSEELVKKGVFRWVSE